MVSFNGRGRLIKISAEYRGPFCNSARCVILPFNGRGRLVKIPAKYRCPFYYSVHVLMVSFLRRCPPCKGVPCITLPVL